MNDISANELARVTGGLTVSEAGKNLVGNIGQWGRAVWGRGKEGFGFAANSDLSLDAYQKRLESYDVHYKPVIPTEMKW